MGNKCRNVEQPGANQQVVVGDTGDNGHAPRGADINGGGPEGHYIGGGDDGSVVASEDKDVVISSMQQYVHNSAYKSSNKIHPQTQQQSDNPNIITAIQKNKNIDVIRDKLNSIRNTNLLIYSNQKLPQRQQNKNDVIIVDVDKNGSSGGFARLFCCLDFSSLWNQQANTQVVQMQMQQQQKSTYSDKHKTINTNSINLQKDKHIQSTRQKTSSNLCGNLCSVKQKQYQLEFQPPQTVDRFIISSYQDGQQGQSPRFTQIKQSHTSKIEQLINQQQQQSQNQGQISTKNDQPPTKYIIRATSLAMPHLPSSHTSSKTLAQLSIPFRVIKLSLPNNILQGLNQFYPEFFTKYEAVDGPRYAKWRMLENGTYVNLLGRNLHGVFLTKDIFYEGYFEECGEDGSKFSPNDAGIFINQEYVYKGELKEGKANGQGTLIRRNKQREKYQGLWFEGSIVQGSITSPTIFYKGQFYNNQLSGNGQLHILNKNIIYKGNFAEGYFEDQQGFYSCKNYRYKGGFKAGKKYGKGMLQYLAKMKRFEGNWVSDRIKNPVITEFSQETRKL